MRRYIISVLAAAVSLAAPGVARAGERLIPSDSLITVRFHHPGQRLVVLVDTDNRPRHWRSWPISANTFVSREDRCWYRLDARRVLLGQHVTVGVPRRCESRAARALRPDPFPG